MTRAARVTQVANAMRKARAGPASPEIVDGETLVRSAGFGSYEQARQAAGVLHPGASRAAFEKVSDHPPPLDLRVRRDAVTPGDRLDAERWLDEGGSFSGLPGKNPR